MRFDQILCFVVVESRFLLCFPDPDDAQTDLSTLFLFVSLFIIFVHSLQTPKCCAEMISIQSKVLACTSCTDHPHFALFFLWSSKLAQSRYVTLGQGK